jgi:hypothetical protein
MSGDNPRESSKVAGSEPEYSAESNCRGPACIYAASLAAVGAIAGVLCYLASAIAIETGILPSLRVPGAPVLSYGAMAVLVIAPLMGTLGASLAVVLFLIWIRKRLAAAALCVVASLGGLMVVGGLWSSDLNRYGDDPSAIVLYVPVAVLCLFLLLVAVVVGALSLTGGS